MSVSSLADVPIACGYPVELEGSFRVRERGVVRVRPLRRGEERPIRELYARLSPDARYFRFSSSTPSVPESVVRLLSDVDQRRRLALVADHDGGAGREVVGLTDFAAIDDRTAELGLVVRDDWHGRGVGTALAVRILDAASQRGFTQFVAHVVAGNRAVRRLIPRVGVVGSVTWSRGEVEIAFVRRR